MTAASVAEEVIVRVYDAAKLGSTATGRAVAVAEAILNAAFFGVRWMPCGQNASMRAACRVPLGDAGVRELIMRVVPAAPPTTAADGRLGDAMVSTSGAATVVGTIYADRVSALAAAAGTDRMVLLGRALAHELGHLIGGSGHHASEGLMRAVWTPGELRRNKQTDWFFAAGDVRRMHQAKSAT